VTEHKTANNAPIGIFDSGVGGLTVLTEVQKALPNESVIYVGDTINVPYGSKSYDELLQYGRHIIKFLLKQNVKAIVLACGTTSSTVYEQLAREFPVPLIDVIRPGVRACAELTGQSQGIGLIATAATVKSGLFGKLLKAEKPSVQFYAQACPLFALMVETGITHGPLAKWATQTYVGGWRGKIDALVLGCTHYPLLSDVLADVLGVDVKLINLATYTAQALKAQLVALGGLSDDNAPPEYKFYVSSDPGAFNKSARFLLHGDLFKPACLF